MRTFKSAERYHQQSKYTFNDIKSVYKELSAENKGYPVKDFQNKPSQPLPESFHPVDRYFHSDIDITSQFGLFHHLKPDFVSLAELSQLLYLTNGTTLSKEFGQKKISFRAAPSAGACYPINIYLVNNRVSDLKQGLYYYHPIDHAVMLLKEGPFGEYLWQETFQLDFIKEAPLFLIFSNTFSRNSWKYLLRGLRYSLLDCGYIVQNLNLAAVSLGLTVNLLGDFCDQNLNKFFNFPASEEISLLLAALGKPANKITTATYTFGMFPEEGSLPGLITDPQQLFYLQSSHEIARNDLININVKLPFKKAPIKKEPLHDLLNLPSPHLNFSETTFQIINKRRSVHNFQRISISFAELSTLLHYLYRIPAMYNFPAYQSYLVVSDVENLANGVYLYHPAAHQLELLKKGTFRGDLSYLTLAQDAVFNASAAIFFSCNFKEIDIFSDRGYRYAHFNIGMASEMVYLIATALNLGVRGIGNYFDDELNAFFNLEDTGEQILGGVVVGQY